MTSYKVVVSDQVFPSVAIERGLLAGIDAKLIVANGGVDDVLAVAADADAILNTYMPWNADAIGRLRRCRIIARYGIGFDNVDLAAASDAGIVVTNVPDYSIEEVATHALALILATLRKVGRCRRIGPIGHLEHRQLPSHSQTLDHDRRPPRIRANRSPDWPRRWRPWGLSIIAHDPISRARSRTSTVAGSTRGSGRGRHRLIASPADR